MAKKNKKPKKSLRPEGIDDRYEKDLIEQKDLLWKAIKQYEERSIREAADVGLWGLVGGIAIMMDVAVLGGIGTGIALGSGALWARYGYNKKRVEKKLKEVEQELQDYQEMKQRLSQRAAEQKPFDPAPAKDDFKKAAEPEAELIKKKQAELDRKLDAIKDLKPPRPEDKPKP